MDTLTLAVETVGRSSGETVPLVTLYVNGRRLVDLVRAVELPFAVREGQPAIAGSYIGLPATIAFLPSLHLLGEPADGWDWLPDAVALLQCECGEPGCWPLLARVTAGPETVTWSDFRQPHRGPEARVPWRYDALPALRFARPRYEQALRPPTRLAGR